MTPLSFDIETSREVAGDCATREIEAKARSDADLGISEPPVPIFGDTYWGKSQDWMRVVIYHAQREKRIQRNARKAAK